MNLLKLKDSHTHQVQNSDREAEESPLSQLTSQQLVEIKEVKFQHALRSPPKKTQRQSITSYFNMETGVVCAFLCILIVLFVYMNTFLIQNYENKDIAKTAASIVNNNQNNKVLLNPQNSQVKGSREESKKQQLVNALSQIKQKDNEYQNENVQQIALKKLLNVESEILKFKTSNNEDPYIPRTDQEIAGIQDTFQQSRNRAKKQIRPSNNKDQNKQKKKQTNILINVTKNPHSDRSYAMITQQQLTKALKWRTLSSFYYNKNCPIAGQQLKYYEQKYNIGNYTQLPFCLVVPTLNNRGQRRAEFNIKSILMQNYSNYRVIIIDDGSVDATVSLIKSFMQKQNKISQDNYKIIANKQRQFALPNVLNAAKNFCKPQDIFMVIDGDDELIGRHVLKIFNSVFQKQKIWFMYTNFITSNGGLGYSRPYPLQIMKNNTYRDYGFTVSHLRAFYTKLLLNIKDEDLRNENGSYFKAAGDMAIAMPCMQQAHERVKYLPQVTYLYNTDTGYNVRKKNLNEQRMNNLIIRNKPRYQALQKLF